MTLIHIGDKVVNFAQVTHVELRVAAQNWDAGINGKVEADAVVLYFTASETNPNTEHHQQQASLAFFGKQAEALRDHLTRDEIVTTLLY